MILIELRGVALNELSIIDFRKIGNAVTFWTDQSVHIVVTFISNKTAKLYVDFSGNSERNSSYAIEAFPAVLSCVDISETDDSFIVSSNGAFHKSSARIIPTLIILGMALCVLLKMRYSVTMTDAKQPSTIRRGQTRYNFKKTADYNYGE
ncbi:MAG: DUF4968 domain-containing protein [Oscillospiraceae bacterium]|nr:DUF4968 domain-containing protein [Oscillospiraceae bacterium]